MATFANLSHLGFLTILQEPNGYLGGYLVTNQWGRPLEFRLSTAVQPNRVQQILYGPTLQAYLCADLIGKTLVEKTAVKPQVIVTDKEAVLDLRRQLSIPVLLLEEAGLSAPTEGKIKSHPRFPEDLPVAREVQERLGEILDLAEPFTRIREALAEARKMGVTSRG